MDKLYITLIGILLEYEFLNFISLQEMLLLDAILSDSSYKRFHRMNEE